MPSVTNGVTALHAFMHLSQKSRSDCIQIIVHLELEEVRLRVNSFGNFRLLLVLDFCWAWPFWLKELAYGMRPQWLFWQEVGASFLPDMLR